MKFFKGLFYGLIATVIFIIFICLLAVACNADTFEKVDENTLKITKPIEASVTYENIENNLLNAQSELARLDADYATRKAGIQSTIDFWQTAKNEADKKGVKKKVEPAEPKEIINEGE